MNIDSYTGYERTVNIFLFGHLHFFYYLMPPHAIVEAFIVYLQSKKVHFLGLQKLKYI